MQKIAAFSQRRLPSANKTGTGLSPPPLLLSQGPVLQNIVIAGPIYFQISGSYQTLHSTVLCCNLNLLSCSVCLPYQRGSFSSLAAHGLSPRAWSGPRVQSRMQSRMLILYNNRSMLIYPQSYCGSPCLMTSIFPLGDLVFCLFSSCESSPHHVFSRARLSG
jgi:hypothetical protein